MRGIASLVFDRPVYFVCWDLLENEKGKYIYPIQSHPVPPKIHQNPRLTRCGSLSIQVRSQLMASFFYLTPSITGRKKQSEERAELFPVRVNAFVSFSQANIVGLYE